jgi:hypothetical protein
MSEPEINVSVPTSPVRYWLGLFALLVLVVGSYAPSMKGEFLWDDDYYVTNNKALSRPDGIEQIWLGVKDPKTYPVPQFYPMTHTSFWVETRGHDWSQPLASWPFHLINVLLHFGSAWMLWTILRRLNCPGAFVAAAIWALHPVQVESVAWITERKNVLSAFFMFASMIVYLRFAKLDNIGEESRGSFALPAEPAKLYALALILFVCSILSKSVTGTMPAVILLLMWWKRGTIKQSDVLPLIPFFVLAIAMGITTSYFEKHVVGAQGADWAMNPIQRCLVAGGAVCFYALKLIAPIKLTFFYPRWELHSPWLAVALGGLVAFVTWLYMARQRLGRGPITVALLFIGTLFPALGFVNFFPMRYSFVADHFQYISCAALITGGVWALHRFFTTPARFTIASALILGALTAMTWSQNHVYQSAWDLRNDTINKNPTAWSAYNNRGVIERETGMLGDAEDDFKRSLAIRPNNVEAIMNLGVVAQKRQDLDGAIELFKQAIDISQQDRAHAPSYARVYDHLGAAYLQKGDLQASLKAYYAAVEHDHRDLVGIRSVGSILMHMGKLDNAKIWFDKAVQIDPLFLPAHADLGNLYLAQHDIAKAQEEYKIVLDHDRTNEVALNGM